MPSNELMEFRENLLNDLQIDPKTDAIDASIVASVIEKLKANSDEGRLIDPKDEQSTFDTWLVVYLTLFQIKLPYQAKQVVTTWYNQLNELQIKNGRRYHKGGAIHNYGVCSFKLGDKASSVWFHACALVEDILSSENGNIPITPATQNLRIIFNWNQIDFENVMSAARAVQSKEGNLWWYPETALVHLARVGKLRLPISKDCTDIPVNRPFLKELIKYLPENGNVQKKESLEFLASYLATTLSGVRIKANVEVSKTGVTFEHEIDLVVTQYSTMQTYLLDAFGRHFLIECKNWSKPVGARDLNHFVAKMRFHRCSCGVIFSKEGLSGDDSSANGLSHARITQLRWYQQDSCVVIIVSKQDLLELADGTHSFADMLLTKYESVRFSSTTEPF